MHLEDGLGVGSPAVVDRRRPHPGRMAWLGLLFPLSVGAQVCPVDQFDPLASLVGGWSVVAEDRLPDLSFEQTTGRSEITSSLLGCGLIVTYSGQREGRNFETVWLLTMRSDGVIDLVSADSVHDGAQHSLGSIAGERIVFVRERDMGGRTLSVRTTFDLESAQAFTVQRELRRSRDAAWEVTYRGQWAREGFSSR